VVRIEAWSIAVKRGSVAGKDSNETYSQNMFDGFRAFFLFKERAGVSKQTTNGVLALMTASGHDYLVTAV